MGNIIHYKTDCDNDPKSSDMFTLCLFFVGIDNNSSFTFAEWAEMAKFKMANLLFNSYMLTYSNCCHDNDDFRGVNMWASLF